MACSIIRNKETNEVEKVLAPNGKESILYQSILKIEPDKEKALEAWAQVYTPSFKEWFGDWEKSTPIKDGLQVFKNKLIDIIGVDKVKELYIGTDVYFDTFTIDTVELGSDKDLIITIKTDFGRRTAFNLRLDGDYQQLKISEGSRTVKGIKAALSEKKTAIDFLISEFKSLNPQEITSESPVSSTSKVIDENGEPALVFPIKDGVKDLLDSNPELASIGTPEQYSAYLDTIFPDSKVKDIVYHGVIKGREAYNNILQKGFDFKTKRNWDNSKSSFKEDDNTGMFFSDMSTGQLYGTELTYKINEKGEYEDVAYDNVIAAILNIENLETGKETSSGTASKFYKENRDKNNIGMFGPEGGSEGVHDNYVVFEPEQIHILGSKQDVEGFKRFVGSAAPSLSTSKIVDENGEPLLMYHNSPNVFRNFDKSFIGSTTNGLRYAEDSELGFFFTDEKSREALQANNIYDALGDKVYTVFLNIKNPDTTIHSRTYGRPIYAEPDTGAPIFPGSREDFKEEKEISIKSGHDGAINTYEDSSYYVAYEPNQIKSVFNEGSFSAETDDIYLQAEPQSEIPSDAELNEKVEKFLEKIGVSVRSVDIIHDAQGNKLNAVAKASMMNKIIEVVNGKADVTTLPEEAAHFFVEMLGESSPLFQDMLNKITGYKLYQVTVEQYRNNKLYRKADGTVDIPKIKKEAIGKLIAQYIIKEEYGTESDAKIKEAYTWWNKLWAFLSELFSKAKIEGNPFEAVAKQILAGDTTGLSDENLNEDEFLQVDGDLNSLIEDQDKINLDNSVDPITKQKRHIYYYGDEQAKGSVTSVYVDAWLKRIFRSDNRTEGQKIIDLAKAEYGDIFHESIQTIIKSYLNEDGTKSDKQSKYAINVPDAIRAKLEDYLEGIMAMHPGAKFMTEVKVYDQKTKVAGSIDLLVIDQDGTVNIYDWKTQEVGKGQTDLKPYKEEMYRIQLKNYKDILQRQYGFNKFGKVRAIPMKTTFTFSGNAISGIKDLEIGDIDPTKIPEDKDYLLPVVIKTESTGNDELDALISKLNGIYDKIKNTSYTKEERDLKREELGRLKTVLKDLHLRKRVNKLIDLGVLEYKKYNKAIENGTLTGKDIMEAGKILEVFSDAGSHMHEMMEEYLQAAKEANDEKAVAAFNDTRTRFNTMRANVETLIKKIEKYRDEEARKLADAEGITNLLAPEAPIGVINGLFASLSKITQASFRTFAALLRRVQNKRDVRFNNMIDEMADLQKEFFDYTSKKGISANKAMDMILDIDDKGNWGGNFLAKYEKSFYTERDEAIKRGDLNWFKENVDFDPNKKFEEAFKRQKEFFESFPYSDNALENKKMQAKKVDEWLQNHSPLYAGKLNGKAFANKNNQFLIPKTKWETTQWKTLQAPENAPLLKVYDYFQKQIKYAKKLGMLENYTPRFVPSIHATKVDQLVFGNIKDLFSSKGFFENLESNTDGKYTPQIDPTDGSIINKVPVYFTRDMGVQREDGTVDYSQKSKDLFKVFAIWGSHMYNYEAMESIEDASLVLLEAERNKKSLVTDNNNRILLEEGKVKAVNNNDRNAKLLETFVNYYLYDRLSGEMKDTTFKMPFGDKEYSAIKTAQAAMKFFSFKTLALNPISGTAQFVGGTGNALFMAAKGKQFTTQEWAEATYLVTAQDKKAKAALDYFDILLEGTKDKKIESMSLSVGNKILDENNGYIIQRTMDKAVQYPVAVAMMRRHMLDENNNIVDIEDFVKAKYDYNTTFYNLPAEKRKEMMSKINEEVGTLKKEKSLLAVATVNDKGKLEIPGLDKESDSYGKFRTKIKAVNKRILGNSTHDDINNMRTSMLGGAFMQFRSWIPEMVEERFAGLKYSDELQQWTYGKMNLFFGELFSKRMPALAKSILTGFGDNAIEAAKQKYQEMKRDAIEKGQEFTISEGEFIDLYLSNLRSEMAELVTVLGFATLVFSVVSIGDDDDDDVKGMKKYARRALSKYYNEFAFYYNPIEFTNLVKSPLPVIGLAEDFVRFTGSMAKEGYGAAFNEEMQESAKPMKYFTKMVPVAKEGMLVMAALDDDFRKDWDIRIDY